MASSHNQKRKPNRLPTSLLINSRVTLKKLTSINTFNFITSSLTKKSDFCFLITITNKHANKQNIPVRKNAYV
jgi:hypothetical protein